MLRHAPYNSVRRGFGTLYFVLFCVPLGLVPLPGWAQETGPVTVVIRFDDEVSFGAGCVPRSTLCASERNSFTLFNGILLPRISTSIEKTELDLQRRKSLFLLTRPPEGESPGMERPHPQRPRVLSGQISYERIDLDMVSIPDIEGDIFSTQAQLLWDVQDYSFGVLMPLDIMELDEVDVQRFGLIGFGQYRFLVNRRTLLTSTVNANYSYAAIDAPNQSDLNIFGGGLSVALSVDQDRFVGGGAMSYQFHIDDSDRDNDTQHLLKIGAQAGLRVVEQAAITLSGTLSYDMTDYQDTVRDVDQLTFDLSLEAAWSLSDRWTLSGGYTKALGFDDFNSDKVFLGASWRF